MAQTHLAATLLTAGLILSAAGCQSSSAGYPSAEAPTGPRAVPAAWQRSEPEARTVLITDKGMVYVWGEDLSQDPVAYTLPANLAAVRRLIPAPWGRGVLLLADEAVEAGGASATSATSDRPGWFGGALGVCTLFASWVPRNGTPRATETASTVLWLDPADGRPNVVYRSARGSAQAGLADAALAQAGHAAHGPIDPAIEDLLVDGQGRLCIRTRDRLAYRMVLDEGRASRLEFVEGDVPAATEAEERETIGGKSGRVVRLVARR